MNPTVDPTGAPAARRGGRRAARVPVAPRRLRRRWRERGGRRRAEGRPQLLELAVTTWTRQGRRSDPDDAQAVHEPRPRSRSTTTRTSTPTPSTSRRSRAGSRRATGIGRDIIVSTDNDRFPGIYVDNGWVQKLDKSLIPNIANLIDAQASPPFDPDREYSLPWFSGWTGSRGTRRSPGRSRPVKQLLEDPKLKGKVGVLEARWATRSASSCSRTATTRRRSRTRRSTGRSR